MNRQETLDYLRSHGIEYELTEHRAVFNMAECADLDLPYPEADAKNLFVRDDKKRCYYLISVRSSKRVDLKQFRQLHGTRPLSFASPEELMELLALTPGSVTPLGLLNDSSKRVKLFLDRDFMLPPCRIGVHPNDNTATVWLNTGDLLRLISDSGSCAELTDI